VSLHEQLLTVLDERINTIDQLGEQDDGMVRVVRAVVELHAPVNAGALSEILICEGCEPGDDATSCPDWPCSTVQAIARELGVEAGEDRG
jgi:hypothetical protein